MLDIKLPVLDKNDNWFVHEQKLKEETKELVAAIQIYNYVLRQETETFKTKEEAAKDLFMETLDVIQVCIGILDKLIKSYPKMLIEVSKDHIEKLHRRGWIFKKWIKIEED